MVKKKIFEANRHFVFQLLGFDISTIEIKNEFFIVIV